MKISMKKRKIGYTYGSLSGNYAFRGEKSIQFESSLERDFITMMEFDNCVVDIVEQPMTFEYVNANGRSVTYTPDFLVYFRSNGYRSSKEGFPKPLLVEVKPRDKLRKEFPLYRDRFKIAMAYAMQNDMVFKIYDESRIRGIYLENILLLKRHRRHEYDEVEEERILMHLSLVGSTNVEHLLTYLYATDIQRKVALGHLLQLIDRRLVGCDLSLPLGYQTSIWLSESAWGGY